MVRYRPDFPSKLKGIDFKTLENNPQSVYGLSKNLELVYINPGWIRFANENGGGENTLNDFPLGTSIIKAIGGQTIKNFYAQNYERVLETGEVWNHEYECSSKDESRLYHQSTYPLKNGEGLIIINTLKVKLPMNEVGRTAYEAVEKSYVNSDGYITQCSNCRNTQRAEQPQIWDWVPAWVEQMPNNFSHSVCPTCLDYFWKYGQIKYTPPNL